MDLQLKLDHVTELGSKDEAAPPSSSSLFQSEIHREAELCQENLLQTKINRTDLNSSRTPPNPLSTFRGCCVLSTCFLQLSC